MALKGEFYTKNLTFDLKKRKSNKRKNFKKSFQKSLKKKLFLIK
jgi:hypothetical protein